MEVRSIERPAGAFQEALSAAEIEALLCRCLGPGVLPVAATELSGGYYNTTYRIELADCEPAILRVAPAPERQFRLEREMLRNEHAALPYLAPIARLLPRTLGADFTHDLIGRDYLIQSVLPGRWAAGELAALSADSRASFLSQLGAVAAEVHAVRGTAFGRVAGPGFGSWSATMLAAFDAIITDLDEFGLDAADLRAITANLDRSALDEITEPRLLHGDLWVGNVMIDEAGRITGVFDHDRAFWGDPFADWSWFMLEPRPPQEQDAFWAGYGGRPADSAGARYRALVYRARSVGESRLEHHRLGRRDGVASTYERLAAVRDQLERA